MATIKIGVVVVVVVGVARLFVQFGLGQTILDEGQTLVYVPQVHETKDCARLLEEVFHFEQVHKGFLVLFGFLIGAAHARMVVQIIKIFLGEPIVPHGKRKIISQIEFFTGFTADPRPVSQRIDLFFSIR